MLYQKWDDGYFGSRNVHKNKLKEFLWKMVGKEFETSHDFMYITTGGLKSKEILCKFSNLKWLKLFGVFNQNKLKEFIKKDPLLHSKWWRTKKLVSIKGKIKKFWLGRDPGGRIITMKLENILFVE